MPDPIVAHEKPEGTYSYDYDARDPEKVVRTTYDCKVPGCGFVHVDDSKARCYRKAKEHRAAHRTSLTGGDQATIFDALGGA